MSRLGWGVGVYSRFCLGEKKTTKALEEINSGWKNFNESREREERIFISNCLELLFPEDVRTEYIHQHEMVEA